MYCWNCGKQQAVEEAKFCFNCGKELVPGKKQDDVPKPVPNEEFQLRKKILQRDLLVAVETYAKSYGEDKAAIKDVFATLEKIEDEPSLMTQLGELKQSWPALFQEVFVKYSSPAAPQKQQPVQAPLVIEIEDEEEDEEEEEEDELEGPYGFLLDVLQQAGMWKKGVPLLEVQPILDAMEKKLNENLERAISEHLTPEQLAKINEMRRQGKSENEIEYYVSGEVSSYGFVYRHVHYDFREWFLKNKDSFLRDIDSN